MSSIYDTKLGRALKLNYWSVGKAMQYLSADRRDQLPDIDQASIPLSNSRPTSKYEKKISTLTRYWYDTDHALQPREGTGSADSHEAEYPVHYFVHWAKSKGLKIFWLDEAIKKGLLPANTTANHQVAKKASQTRSNAPLLHPKKERSYLLIIAALMKQQGIDWRVRGANKKLRDLVENCGDTLEKDAIGKVLNGLDSCGEGIDSVIESLKKRT